MSSPPTTIWEVLDLGRITFRAAGNMVAIYMDEGSASDGYLISRREARTLSKALMDWADTKAPDPIPE